MVYPSRQTDTTSGVVEAFRKNLRKVLREEGVADTRAPQITPTDDYHHQHVAPPVQPQPQPCTSKHQPATMLDSPAFRYTIITAISVILFVGLLLLCHFVFFTSPAEPQPDEDVATHRGEAEFRTFEPLASPNIPVVTIDPQHVVPTRSSEHRSE